MLDYEDSPIGKADVTGFMIMIIQMANFSK
jgi:hypothetical protein